MSIDTARLAINQATETLKEALQREENSSFRETTWEQKLQNALFRLAIVNKWLDAHEESLLSAVSAEAWEKMYNEKYNK